ncbi:hypothetical protein M9435_002293 [Picochlorum sp. BPE23]|nr:hypothetical protein M9435_002293 [Picochlorum sp. BPE23]
MWWEAYFSKSSTKKKLSLLYLANDVLQTSRKKGPEYVQEFLKVLPKAVAAFLQKADDAGKKSVDRMISVWEKRQVFGSKSSKFRRFVEDADRYVTAAKAEGKSRPVPRASDTAQPSIPSYIQTLMEKMDRAAMSHQQRTRAEHTYDNSHGQDVGALQNFQQALKDEMDTRKAVIDHLEVLVQEEHRKYNAALGALSVLPSSGSYVEQPAVEEDGPPPQNNNGASEEVQIVNDDEKKNEASEIAAQVMNDPAALLDILQSMPGGATK